MRRLLDKYHCDRYKVYNFASELAQMTPLTQRVDARVERYGVLELISRAGTASTWLQVAGVGHS